MAKDTEKNAGNNVNEVDEDAESEDGDDTLDSWWVAGKKGKLSKKVKYICNGGDEPCDKVIGANSKEKSIQCEACLEWFHAKCQGLCAEAFGAIQSYDLLWICKDCKHRLYDVLNTGRKIEACIEKAEKRIT